MVTKHEIYKEPEYFSKALFSKAQLISWHFKSLLFMLNLSHQTIELFLNSYMNLLVLFWGFLTPRRATRQPCVLWLVVITKYQLVVWPLLFTFYTEYIQDKQQHVFCIL